MKSLLKLIPSSVLLSFLIELLVSKAQTDGRKGIERALTLPEQEVRNLAKKMKSKNADYSVARSRAFATAGADLILSFIPDEQGV